VTEKYVIEGRMYLKKWFAGFYGAKNEKVYSLEASLPEGIKLHGRKVRMTIEVK